MVRGDVPRAARDLGRRDAEELRSSVIQCPSFRVAPGTRCLFFLFLPVSVCEYTLFPQDITFVFSTDVSCFPFWRDCQVEVLHPLPYK